MLKLHKDAGWIVSHAWSFRFLVLAAALSGAEAALPLFTEHPPLPRRIFAVVIFVVVAGALVARLIVQRHPPTLFEAPNAVVVATAPDPTPVPVVPA
jgi:hypothetical protein